MGLEIKSTYSDLVPIISINEIDDSVIGQASITLEFDGTLTPDKYQLHANGILTGKVTLRV